MQKFDNYNKIDDHEGITNSFESVVEFAVKLTFHNNILSNYYALNQTRRYEIKRRYMNRVKYVHNNTSLQQYSIK